MIIDYEYSQRDRKFTISYVNEKGTKSFYECNVNKFKTYSPSPTGRFLNWDGTRCEERYTDKPNKFDIKEFIEDLPDNIKDVLFGKYMPKLYSWDIETKYDPLEKPDPQSAKFPITSISVANPEMVGMVMGYKPLSEEAIKRIRQKVRDYLNNIPFFRELNLQGDFIYKYFPNEHDMIAWYCKNIVAKVPILAGWNSNGFDQPYLENRIINYYDDISLASMSCKYRMGSKKVVNPFKPTESVRIPTPHHTHMVDLMDVIGSQDYTVLPIKESLSLDWIAEASIGANKIEYEGNLNTLYDDDYELFVFYNVIDSILVQLIHQKFKTMNLIYNYANVCHIPVGDCYGKILPTEALFFQEYHSQGLKVVYYPDRHVERGTLIGAYVKEPFAGLYFNPSCFDFSGLYPTNVQCFNFSPENFIAGFYLEDKLEPYRRDPVHYIVSGPNVYRNAGKIDKPKLGEFVAQYVDWERCKPYMDNPDYIVSINGSVYKNDKDYAFKRIQLKLKAGRNETKYLAKEMDAQVMSVIDRVLHTKSNDDWTPFTDDVRDWMIKNYNISDKKGIVMYADLVDLKRKVQADIDYMYMREQSFKLLMNSAYGGSSHQSCYWYNMALANDITGEGRNLIHMMEKVTVDIINNFRDASMIHKLLGVTIDKVKFDKTIINNDKMVYTIYQDTDSSYINLGSVVACVNELKGKGDKEKVHFLASFAEHYMNKEFDKIITDYLTKRHAKNYHVFELETIGKTGIWIGVKKRYAQSILWKDGRIYDEPKIKVKGLEVIKGSYPSYSRKILKELLNMLLLNEEENNDVFIHKINQTMMKYKGEFYNRPIDDITEALKVNDYWKGVESDDDPTGLKMKSGSSFNQKALGLYNWLINTKGLPGDNIYGGKIKCYLTKKTSMKSDDIYFAYSAGKYPAWGEKYAPIDKDAMFTKTVLEPINRILTPIGMKELHIDGSLEMNLFDW